MSERDPLDAYPLTLREREVIRGALAGRTSREIADEVNISARTVGKHLEHAYAKLGVTGRRGARRLLYS